MRILNKLLFIGLIIFTSISCSGDEEDSSPESVDNRAKIIGRWKLSETLTNGVKDDHSADCELANTLDFDSSGVNVGEAFGSGCSGTESTYEEYSINGDVLRVGDTTLDILILNAATLKVKYRDQTDYVETYLK